MTTRARFETPGDDRHRGSLGGEPFRDGGADPAGRPGDEGYPTGKCITHGCWTIVVVMLDMIIRGGTVVDGTGAPGRIADVGISNGRITTIGPIDASEAATRTIDADGKVVAPGFIDIHTHYDAQVFWDTTLSPSPLHGVTTVIGGNCGFTIAPLGPEHGDYLMRDARPRRGHAARRAGRRACRGTGRASASISTASTARSRPNAGFLVGHSTIRRRRDGRAGHRKARRRQRSSTRCRRCSRQPRRGRAGLLVELGPHPQRRGRRHPVPSRYASADEIVALCSVVGNHPGTTLEFIPSVGRFEEFAPDLLTRMSLAANRPVNWNVLFVGKGSEAITEHNLAASDYAAERGAPSSRSTVPFSPSPASASTAASCSTPFTDGASRWLSPTTRRRQCSPRPTGATCFAKPARQPTTGFNVSNWGIYVINETFAPENKRWEGKSVAEIAKARDVDAFDASVRHRRSRRSHDRARSRSAPTTTRPGRSA